MAFVCVLRVNLHLPDAGSLKGKRKHVASLKAQLRSRFGVSVSETDHHDLWQRSTLTVAVVGRDARAVEREAGRVERFVESQHPDGAWIERGLISSDEVIGAPFAGIATYPLAGGEPPTPDAPPAGGND